MIDRKNSIQPFAIQSNIKSSHQHPQTARTHLKHTDKHQKQRSALHPHEGYISNFANEKVDNNTHKKKNKK